MYKTINMVGERVVYDEADYQTGLFYTNSGYEGSPYRKPIKVSEYRGAVLQNIMINYDCRALWVKTEAGRKELEYFEGEFTKVLNGEDSIWRVVSVMSNPEGIRLELKSRMLEDFDYLANKIKKSGCEGLEVLEVNYRIGQFGSSRPYFVVDIKPTADESLYVSFYQGRSPRKAKSTLRLTLYQASEDYRAAGCSVRFLNRHNEREEFCLRWADAECQDMIITDLHKVTKL